MPEIRKTARRRHRARLDGFWHGDLAAPRRASTSPAATSRPTAVARFVADGGEGAATPAEAAKARRHRRQRGRQRRPDRDHPVRRGRRRRNAGQGRGVHLLRHHGPGRGAAAGEAAGGDAAGTISMRRSPAARSARRRANSPFWPPAVRRPSPRRGRRSMRWRQSSTNSATPPGRAPRSR